MAFAWENRPLHAQHAEEDGDAIFWGVCSDDEDGVESSPGDDFVSYMLQLMYETVVSAKVFCVIMYLAGKAGISEAAPFGLAPGSPKGHYSRKVKRKLGWLTTQDFMYVNVVGQGKHDIERSEYLVPFLPAHEQVAQDRDGLDASKIILEQKKTSNDLPPCYWNHPVVQNAAPDETVLPIAVYLDGLPYSQTDSVIGFWVVNLLDGARYLCGLLRKRLMCMCGCRGWCTFFCYFCYLNWCLRALARGEYPLERFDGPWHASSDKSRSEKGGQSLGCKFACLYLKGDWAEFAISLGLPTWHDSLRPCFNCNCSHENMFEIISGATIENLTWLINGSDDYFNACDRCEIVVQLLCPDNIRLLLSALRYDKWKTGSKGRALVRDIEAAVCLD